MRVTAGAALAAALVLWACANVSDPPGGPPDAAAPLIVAVTPESGTVMPEFRGAAEIQFDEVVDEMPGSGGGSGGNAPAGLANLVQLSPVAGPVRITWHRTSIRIRPKEGWRPNRVYRLELLPGVMDLRRNKITEHRTIIFSTGPAIPHATLTGTVLQWVEQRPLAGGIIEAVPRGDSVGYVTATDSSGAFTLSGIPAGDYVVYALQDRDNDRQRDLRELWDSSTVRIDSSASTILWPFARDTAGPRLRQADRADSLSIRITFTQALDPAQTLALSQIDVLALPDSTPRTIQAVLTPAAYDSLAARERAAADSAARTPADSAPPVPARDQDDRRAPRDTAAAAQLRALLAARPRPYDVRVLRLSAPLVAGGRYLVRVRGARNLNGATGDGQAVLAVPEPPPAAPRDTTRRPAPANRP